VPIEGGQLLRASASIVPTTLLRQTLAVPADGALTRAPGLLPSVKACKSYNGRAGARFTHYLQFVHAFWILLMARYSRYGSGPPGDIWSRAGRHRPHRYALRWANKRASADGVELESGVSVSRWRMWEKELLLRRLKGETRLLGFPASRHHHATPRYRPVTSGGGMVPRHVTKKYIRSSRSLPTYTLHNVIRAQEQLIIHTVVHSVAGPREGLF
jgi:hypothetical protein